MQKISLPKEAACHSQPYRQILPKKPPAKNAPNIKHKILQHRNLNTKNTTYTAQSKTQYEKWVSDPTVHVEKE
jgi:hypothetical protein